MRCARSTPSPWSSSVLSWALVVLWLSCSCLTPGTAQSTPPGAVPPSSPLNGEWSLSKASSELVRRLTERKAEAESLQADLQTLNGQLLDLRGQLTASQLAQADLQTALTATSTSLEESRTQLADYRAAVSDQLHLDQTAIDQARAERDAWRVGGIVAGVVAVVVVVVAVLR